ncbi:DUF5694 domain-containing protein [Alicyclobacillus fodiniaquatilis]|uniref:DUF5694 domain-containing protein n=1 Tax=Alicyclobacillus fodiniaquatilis TaxID=1661150 RepID=A0ABW4JIC4_9BACL
MSDAKPSVMVLGSVHLNNPGLDMHNTEFDDMRTEKRQAQIQELVSRLQRFQPTHVALEAPSKIQCQLSTEYQQYLDGKMELSPSEGHQIGFRIAKELGHESVYAVDWMEHIGNRALGEVYEWARSHQPGLLEDEPFSEEDVTQQTILDIFRNVNQPAAALENHRWYIQKIARVGMGEEHIGIDWLRWWYQRNLIVYDKVTRLMQSPSDRVLVIYGAGHLHLLTQFFKESGLCQVVNSLDYLSDGITVSQRS